MTVEDLESGLERLRACLSEGRRAGTGAVAARRLFEVLSMLPREPAHSAMLAWLLDPKACHGLGDSFLKAFWVRLLGECPAELTPVLVCRQRPRAGAPAEIVLTGPGWRIVVEVTAERSRASTEPHIAWRVRREDTPALSAHLLPAA